MKYKITLKCPKGHRQKITCDKEGIPPYRRIKCKPCDYSRHANAYSVVDAKEV